MDRDTAEQISDLLRVNLPDSASFRLEEQLETPLVGFHHWADGKDCAGAFRVSSDTNELNLLLIQWSARHPSRFALVAYGSSRSGILFEVHEVRDNDLSWAYRPAKRDRRNSERRGRFDALASQRGLPVEDSRVAIPVPKNPDDVERFLSTVFLLADVRTEADDLSQQAEINSQGTDSPSQESVSWDRRHNQIRDGIVSDGSFDTLRLFARWADDTHPTLDAACAWLANELTIQKATASHEINCLQRSGLLSKTNGHLVFPRDVARWVVDPSDTTTPIRIMHGRIRFLGELLGELASEAKTTRELLAVATEHFGFQWTSTRQIDIRLKWLRAAGLVTADERGCHSLSPDAASFVNSLDLQPRFMEASNGEPRYWLMALGPRAKYWIECRREGIACLGWDEVGDLSEYASREQIDLGRNNSLACWQFCHDIEPGDTIFVKLGTTAVVGHGTVTSPYRFDDARPAYKNVRDVNWHSNFPSGVAVRDKRLVTKTLTDVSDYPDLVEGLKRAVGVLPPLPDAQVEPTYSIDSILEDGCFLDRRELEGLLTRLETKKNLVLQGPPGTGKTWLAKRLAYALIGRRDRKRICTVQFHPTLSYEDFVLGWRPSASGLELTDGTFLRAVKSASADPENPFVVVIEEINRGNPAQIFGELITLLEADKRSEDEALELSYTKGDEPARVFVPENLHVIGTMNVADRSLALVDLALRRRFAFATLKPRINGTWHRWVTERLGIDEETADDIQRRMAGLNEAIEKSLGEQFCVGHSYVTPTRRLDPECVKAWFRDVVETELAPLLEEYWFDDPGRAGQERERLLNDW